jgi:hypothetical protein
MDVEIVSLRRPTSPSGDGLTFKPSGGGLDPRLVAVVRLLARRAADEYYDWAVAPREAQPPQR